MRRDSPPEPPAPSEPATTSEPASQAAVWPRLFPDFRPLPGRIKQDYEDFVVEEVRLYPCSGNGTHVHFLIEKRGLSTFQAVQDVATALNVGRRDIGFAGMKDARAVARQWLSVEHVPPERVLALSIPRLRVLEAVRHGNKLRLGHLRANRFTVRIRDTEPQRSADLERVVERLARVGVPNYFGEQRFGSRGDTWRVGRAIIAGDLNEALDVLLGQPGPRDAGDIKRARELYERGEFSAAARLWPRLFQDERRALKALERTRGNRRRAFLTINPAVRRFYVSAYQSHLFNEVVAARLPGGLGTLLPGDLAWIHANGSVFRVDDPAVEQPRADAFEISPTGPLLGYRVTWPEGPAGEVENDLLLRHGLSRAAFRSPHLRVKGQRRPLRFQPGDVSVQLVADGPSPYLELYFTLSRGCYATAFLRELFTVTTHGGEGVDSTARPELSHE
jgi:tRNA pseudouridine13 synthase